MPLPPDRENYVHALAEANPIRYLIKHKSVAMCKGGDY